VDEKFSKKMKKFDLIESDANKSQLPPPLLRVKNMEMKITLQLAAITSSTPVGGSRCRIVNELQVSRNYRVSHRWRSLLFRRLNEALKWDEIMSRR
jgi:hypothetical protein